MLVNASDFINLGENAITVNFDGVDISGIWSTPTLLGSSDQLYTAITLHIDSADSSDPEGKTVIKDSLSYTVQTARKVLRGAMWKLVLSNDS